MTGLGVFKIFGQRPVKVGFDELFELYQGHIRNEFHALVYRHRIFKKIHVPRIEFNEEAVDKLLTLKAQGSFRPVGQLLPQIDLERNLLQPVDDSPELIDHNAIARLLTDIFHCRFLKKSHSAMAER